MLTGTLILQIIATSASLFMCIMTILGAINWSRKNRKGKKQSRIDELRYNISFIENEIMDLKNKPIDSEDKVLCSVITQQIDAREKQVKALKEELDKLTK